MFRQPPKPCRQRLIGQPQQLHLQRPTLQPQQVRRRFLSNCIHSVNSLVTCIPTVRLSVGRFNFPKPLKKISGLVEVAEILTFCN